MSKNEPSGVSLRASDILRSAECSAVRIRKLLASSGRQASPAGTSGSMHDAVRLAELIERLAHHGQKLPAAEAMQVADYVEWLVDVLLAELHGSLA